jgi:hypothetical protein
MSHRSFAEKDRKRWSLGMPLYQSLKGRLTLLSPAHPANPKNYNLAFVF